MGTADKKRMQSLSTHSTRPISGRMLGMAPPTFGRLSPEATECCGAHTAELRHPCLPAAWASIAHLTNHAPRLPAAVKQVLKHTASGAMPSCRISSYRARATPVSLGRLLCMRMSLVRSSGQAAVGRRGRRQQCDLRRATALWLLNKAAAPACACMPMCTDAATKQLGCAFATPPNSLQTTIRPYNAAQTQLTHLPLAASASS